MLRPVYDLHRPGALGIYLEEKRSAVVIVLGAIAIGAELVHADLRRNAPTLALDGHDEVSRTVGEARTVVRPPEIPFIADGKRLRRFRARATDVEHGRRAHRPMLRRLRAVPGAGPRPRTGRARIEQCANDGEADESNDDQHDATPDPGKASRAAPGSV